MDVTVFGISNCDTVKRARVWLAEHGVEYGFHDFKKLGVDQRQIMSWIKAAGLNKVLNRAGTTFRKLPDDAKANLNAEKASELMVAQPSCVKRPIVEYPGGLLVGFDPEVWAKALT